MMLGIIPVHGALSEELIYEEGVLRGKTSFRALVSRQHGLFYHRPVSRWSCSVYLGRSETDLLESLRALLQAIRICAMGNKSPAQSLSHARLPEGRREPRTLHAARTRIGCEARQRPIARATRPVLAHCWQSGLLRRLHSRRASGDACISVYAAPERATWDCRRLSRLSAHACANPV